MNPDYTRSIVNIPVSILARFNILSHHPTLPELDQRLAQADHIALVVLDGFGLNLLKRHLSPDGWMQRHLLTPLTSVFPSTTTAATTALLTGLTPYESGYLGWFQYFKDYDTYFTPFLAEDYYDPAKAIHLDFKTLFKRATFIEQIAQKDPSLNTAIHFPKPIDKDGYPDRTAGYAAMLARMHAHPRTLSYFYAVEPDLTQHKVGPNGAATGTQARLLEAELKQLQQQLPAKSVVIVTADHGLTDVEPLPLHAHTALLAMLKHHPANEARATTFFVKPGLEDAFEKTFNDAYADAYTLYTKDALLEHGWLGHGTRHPFIDQCLGQFRAIAKQSKFFTLGSFGPSFKGHHAGMTDDEMLVPLIVLEGVEHP